MRTRLWLALLLGACGGDDTTDVGAIDAAVLDVPGVDVPGLDVPGLDAPLADVPSDAGPLPTGLVGIDDFAYLGAYRIAGGMYGASSTDYATGALGYRPDHGSLYLAGFAPEAMVGEFAIPASLGTGTDVASLPVVDTALQSFQPVLDAGGNPQHLDTVTGMLFVDGDLVINANVWYDAAGTVSDTTIVVRGGQLDGTIDGWFRLGGRALAAGYLSPIPDAWRAMLGGPVLTGWASNYSIVSRYSVGPTLYAFDPSALTAGTIDVPTVEHLSYPYSGGTFLDPGALDTQCMPIDAAGTPSCSGAGAADRWNFLAKAMYGFIVPGTRTFALFGHLGGTATGIGYKILQDDGNLCGGYCARGASDHHNHYWLYDLDTILAASSPSMPQPYAHGDWDVPFDGGGAHAIVGGAYAPDRGVLYLSLSAAGQVGDYDRPPVIVAFDVP